MKKLKIVSDGSAMGTKVIDVKSGEMIEGVMSIVWKCGVEDDQAKVILEIANVSCEMEGKG